MLKRPRPERHGCFAVAVLTLAFAQTALAGAPPPTPAVDLQLIATADDQVVHIANSGVAADDRLFLVRKSGIIELYDSGSILPTPFLDIDSVVVDPISTGDERGLLSVAFHPDYGSNGYLYVNYINNSGDTVVARYSVSGDPDVADSGSALQILEVAQPAGNHNGGQIAFGPDDYLYIGMGDGGSGCDAAGVGCNAQKTDSLLGAMLRIDVDADDFPADATRNYAIPMGNPFVLDGSVLDEIWSYGWRNPWRFSFDRTTGDLWIGDVGQSGGDRREEVNFQAAASSGGENWGWPVAEGNQCDPGTCGLGSCPTPIPDCMDLTFPVYDYGSGCAVTGGFVYRGADIPDLSGLYVFGDYCSGDIVALNPSTLDDPVVEDTGFELTSFGEDIDGELYVAVGEQIYQIVSAGTPTPTPSPTSTPTPAPPADCPSAPAAGCRTAAKGILKVNDRADNTKDLFLWKWIKGDATTQIEFGADPVNGSSSYAICVFDESAATPNLVLELLVDRAGDICGNGKPCFKAIGGDPPSGKGWKYKDTALSSEGVQKMILKGGDAGKAKIVIKAKGADIGLPPPVGGQYFDQDTNVIVQLISNDGGACFESTLSAPAIKNDVDKFKDKL